MHAKPKGEKKQRKRSRTIKKALGWIHEWVEKERGKKSWPISLGRDGEARAGRYKETITTVQRELYFFPSLSKFSFLSYFVLCVPLRWTPLFLPFSLLHGFFPSRKRCRAWVHGIKKVWKTRKLPFFSFPTVAPERPLVQWAPPKDGISRPRYKNVTAEFQNWGRNRATQPL